ncbi:MAG: hypothetical protein V4864_12900 [Pseudomonadota bacterium]
MEILALVESAPHEVATEALYFCLRALKQAGLANESKKDYFHDTDTSLPSPVSVELAQQVLQSICVAESAPDIDHVARFRIDHYITEVARASDTISSRTSRIDLARGAELLRKMRDLDS